MTRRLRFEIFKRDNFTCIYCGRGAPHVVLEVDHVQARANEGTDHHINLVTSCEACNRGKSDIPLTESRLTYQEFSFLVDTESPLLSQSLAWGQPLTVEQIAIYLRTNETIIRQLIARGMPHMCLGKRILRFDTASVQSWLTTDRIVWEQQSAGLHVKESRANQLH